MSEYDRLFQLLSNFTDQTKIDTDECIQKIAKLSDASLDSHRLEGMEVVLKAAAEMLKRELTSPQLAHLHYCIGNTWSSKKQLIRTKTEDIWEWEQEEIENEVIHFRFALKYISIADSTTDLPCRILTNLGNLFSQIGRFVEAIEYYDRALEIDCDFGEALGNKAICLNHYANVLYDPSHSQFLRKFSHRWLTNALETPLPEYTRTSFEDTITQIEKLLSSKFIKAEIDMESHKIGETDDEIEYRKWCLKNRLFLNPLNDLGPYPIGGRDIFTMSPITTQPCDGPFLLGHFSHMKQEFISARYLFYSGIKSCDTHYSDKETYLHNTLDYPVYSWSLEKVKSAFRVAYSLFDKISYYLNAYFNLSISINGPSLSFKKVWYKKQIRKKGLRLEFRKCNEYEKHYKGKVCPKKEDCMYFQQHKNWPLRGLFWLSKDLREPDFTDSIEPDASEIDTIRNHLEHKYLKVHEDSLITSGHRFVSPSTPAKTTYLISRTDLETKTLRMLKLVRAGLIYLSLSVNIEERIRNLLFQRNQVPQIHFDMIDDEWKI